MRSMMTEGEAVTPYDTYIQTGLHGRRFLRTREEQQLLRTGVEDHGLDFATARQQVRDAAARRNVALQSDVDTATGALLDGRGPRAGRLPRAEFDRATAFYRARAGGQMPQQEVESRVKGLVNERGIQPRAEGWLWRSRAWFDRIPDQPASPLPDGPAVPGAVAGSSRPAPPVEQILNEWVRRANAVQTEPVVSMYAPDGVLLATAAPDPRVGTAAIRQYFQTLLAHPRFQVTLGPMLANTGGDPATISGLYEFSWIGETGQPVVVPSRYTFVLTTPRGAAAGGALDGSILQHHSSSLPSRPAGGGAAGSGAGAPGGGQPTRGGEATQA